MSGLKWRFLLLLLALLAPCHRIGSAGSLSLCLLLFLMVQVYGSSRSGYMARASYCVASFQTKGTGQEEYVSTRPVTQDSSRYVGRPGCSCAAQQGSSQAGLNILLSARAFSSICTCLPRSDAPGNLQLFLWQVKPCGSAIHGATTGTPAFISLGLLIVHIHGLPVLPWQVEVRVGIVGCVPGYTLRVPGALHGVRRVQDLFDA